MREFPSLIGKLSFVIRSKLFQTLALSLVVVCSLAISSVSVAAVLRDSVLTPTWTWDFARENCVCEPCSLGCSPGDQTPRDFNLVFVLEPPIFWSLVTPYGGQPLGDVPLDSVAVAPDSGYVGSINAIDNEELTIGHTYVLRTMGGGHALITPLSLSLSNGMTFLYKFQPDGTGIFIPGAPVARTTWGNIKVKYGRGKVP